VTHEMDRDELLADLVAARASNPGMQVPEGVDAALWNEAGELAVVASALRHRALEVPALEDDPVAASLGLVPDARYALEPKALSKARKATGLTASGLASSLNARGWQIRTADILRWEGRHARDVPPALIAALAAVLGTTPDLLSRTRGVATGDGGNDAESVPSALQIALNDPRFALLARRLARLRGISQAMAESTLRSRGLATVHRGGEPDPERWLDSLEAFVGALEERGE
jgi:hypothetical protein